MKKARKIKALTALLLCAVLLCPALTAFADGAEADSIIDAAVLTDMTETYAQEHDIPSDRLSIGYYYSGTGDEWYYNGDMWYYPASMYKVPLMMLLAEKVSAGEMSQDDIIEGMTLSYVEELILTYSNNDFAHYMRNSLGGDSVWRENAKKFARLGEEDYPIDYSEYGFFSARYTTQVMETLYNQPERFPNLIPCLLQAQYGHYFRLSDSINGVYDVAQKYGSYCDDFGQNFNHNTGIIYTPIPCIVTVMTVNVPDYEKVISDIAVMLTDYTLTLCQRQEAYEREQQEKAQAREAEERAEREQAEQERLERERERQEEQERLEREATERLLDLRMREQKLKYLAVAAAMLLVFITLLIIAVSRARRKRRRLREFERRFERELRQERAAARYEDEWSEP